MGVAGVLHAGELEQRAGMFDIEARWISGQLASYPRELISPLVDIGSSTREFRECAQPWVADRLFYPLAERGIQVVHLDARAGDGIDIRADLLNDADFAAVRSHRFRGLLCCNVLEHVRDAAEFARRCSELVAPGGFIVVTVPFSYPRHGDPIDTLYRPTPEEAARLFPDSKIVAAEIIDVGASYRDDVHRRPWILLRHLLRLPAPFLGIEKWLHSMRKPFWLFHNYRISAALLRREI